jgi:uncharacterized protein
MPRPKFFRDPVHVQLRFDDVSLEDSPKDLLGSGRESWLLRKLIDSSEFQRLRFVRQNGLANLVFHGAEHTRFTHSLGVSHLAGLMYDSIVRNCSEASSQDDRLLIATAALLHDIGHGPFSHTMEEILRGIGKEFDHEDMTVRYINEATAVNGPLCQVDQSLPGLLTKFFDKSTRDDDNWRYRIVSSQLDADRLDYLLRDAMFSGIRGASFDLDRIIDMLYHHDGKSIALEIGALEAVESYLFTLDHMYRAIYYHHAVRAATQGLLSAIKRAVQLHIEDRYAIPSIYPSGLNPFQELLEHGSGISIESYSRLSEFQLWQYLEIWRDSEDVTLADLSSRILERRLFKTIIERSPLWCP